MSDVVVSVVESVTSVTVSEQDVAVAVTESPVTIVTGTSGVQGATGPTGATGAKGDTGAQGASGVIAVDGTYITNSGTSTSANLSFVPSALTIAQSQVTSLVSDLAGKAALTASQTFTGTQTIVSGNNASKTLIVKRNSASQTANLQEWQNESGGILAQLNIYGEMYLGLLGTNYQMRSYSGGAALVPMTVRGAASQTANLQEWQNSAGSILSYVNSSGVNMSPRYQTTGSEFAAAIVNGGGFAQLKKATASQVPGATDFARLFIVAGTNAGTLKLVVRAGTAGAETTILDNIPQ